MAIPKRGDGIERAHLLLVEETLAKHGVPRDECGEVAGQVLLVASEALARGASIDSMAAWLVTLARFGALGYCKQNGRRTRREVLLPNAEALDVPAGTADPERQAIAENGLRHVQRLLEGLSPEQMEVWLLYEGTRMEVTEVAAALNIPDGTAARRLHDARKSLDAGVQRLKARLAHRGETLGVVPLPLLLSAWWSGGLPPDEGTASRAARRAVPRRAWAARWLAAQLPALAIGAAGAMGISTSLARCDPPPVEEAISMEPAAAVTESAPAALPPIVSASAASAPVVQAAVVATAAPDELGLERVQALLETARTALVAGHAGEALGVLAQLDRRDRRGLLGTQRELTRIEALMSLGRISEARARAVRLGRVAPDSPARKRLAREMDAMLAADRN